MGDSQLRKEWRHCMKLEIGCQDVNWIKQDQHIGLWHLATNETCSFVMRKMRPIFKAINITKFLRPEPKMHSVLD